MTNFRYLASALMAGVLILSVNAASKKISRLEAIKPVADGELRLEPMFASVGITYGSAKREGLRFEYRKAGDKEWKATYTPYWYEEVNNYRGMAWKLEEDTEYEVRVMKAKAKSEGEGGEVLYQGKFRTWKSEVPVVKTVYLDENTKFPLTISDQGSEDGWVRYTTKPGVTLTFAPKETMPYETPMIGVKDAKYVLLDNLKIIGGDVRRVINLSDSQYVRVRNCDISGFGHMGECRLDFAGLYYSGYDAEKDMPLNGNRCCGINIGMGMVGTVVERCYIHDPVGRSTTWRHSHPAGPVAISANHPAHSTSLRYNNIVGADGHRWDDAVTGGGNFDPDGGFNRTAEIYGNFFVFANDDCIELDGGQQNVACWGNRFEGSAVGVSIQGNVVSPSFVFDNLFSGQCEERGHPGSTIKTSGFDIYGQGPFSAVFDNVLWGRSSKGINVNATQGADPNHATSNAGRVGGIDCIGNVFCGSQTLLGVDKNPKGIVKDNRLKVDMPESGLDRAHPYNHAPFLLDTCVIDVGRDHVERVVKVKNQPLTTNHQPLTTKFEVVKPSSFDWFEVEPMSGVIEEGMTFTVRFKPGLKDAPVYRGAFLVRTEDGYARPVTVYARTGWTQREKCEKPGTTAVYAYPKDGVKDKDGYMVYTFEAPKDARYFFHVYAQADQWPTAMAAVDDDQPKNFMVQTCWQYPVWCVIWPGQPMFSVKPGRLKHYDLKAGKHTLRIKGKRGDFKPLAFVMTDNPLDFEPLIDYVTKE